MSGIPLETCWAFNERWNNKFCYKVASCWLFLLSHINLANKFILKISDLRTDKKFLRLCKWNSWFFSMTQRPPVGQGLLRRRGFAIALRHTTLGKTPLGEWSARRRDLYLTTHNTHNRQMAMPPAEFEPIIPASERPQTHTLDRAATGIGEFPVTGKTRSLYPFHGKYPLS